MSKVGNTLKHGLCELKTDDDVQEFLGVGYESKWVVDLYVEHYRYDAMDYKNSLGIDYESGDSSDAYFSSDEELNGHFRGFMNELIPTSEELKMKDPESSTLELTHKVQRGTTCPRHDP
ncbi:hypothetical protein Tco_1057335 [Tanacetum coccineum]|uniref:Uncharacterized protein n=1 Tax=Tanacetum coccineum TaxID=301880 RepID=A0ABQ5H544_9ASTR